MNGRAWLVTSWTGRTFLGAIVLKGLVLLALWITGGTVALENADRIVNLALITLALIAVVDLTLTVRARLLWRVPGHLDPSPPYVLARGQPAAVALFLRRVFLP